MSTGLSAGRALTQEIQVDGPAGLHQIIRQAPAGSTLVLAPGDYGALELHGDIGATVIRSADPENRARFSSVDVRGTIDLSFEDLLFDYIYNAGDAPTTRPFRWQNTVALQLRGNIFNGDVAHGQNGPDEGFGIGFGLVIDDSQDVLLEDNEIFNFFKGLRIRNAEDVTVRSNRVHTIRSDGMNFVQVAHILIEDNHIHDFRRSLEAGDHADMIQFWTSRTEWSSHDVVIRGNVLNSGGGWSTQSIFMRNERSDRSGSVDPSLFYRNIIIEENVIINAHTNAIFVGDAIGVTVRRNTLVQNPRSARHDPTSGRTIPAIRVAEINRDVTIRGNIVGQIVGYGAQSDWEVAGNLIIQNRFETRPDHYGAVFLGRAPDQLATYRYRPGGPADGTGIGAPMLE